MERIPNKLVACLRNFRADTRRIRNFVISFMGEEEQRKRRLLQWKWLVAMFIH